MTTWCDDGDDPERVEKYLEVMNKTLIKELQRIFTEDGYSQTEVYTTYKPDKNYPQFLNIYVICSNFASIPSVEQEDYKRAIVAIIQSWVGFTYKSKNIMVYDYEKENDWIIGINLDWIDFADIDDEDDFSDDDLDEDYYTYKSRALREADEDDFDEDEFNAKLALHYGTLYVKVSSTKAHNHKGNPVVTKWLNVKDYNSWEEFADDLEEAGLDASNESSLFMTDWWCGDFDIDDISKYSVREFIETILLSGIRNNEESWTYLCAFMEAKNDFDEFLDLAQSWGDEWYSRYSLYPNMSVEKFGEQYFTEMFTGIRYFDDIMKELEDFIDWDAYGQYIIDKGDAYSTSYGILEHVG